MAMDALSESTAEVEIKKDGLSLDLESNVIQPLGDSLGSEPSEQPEEEKLEECPTTYDTQEMKMSKEEKGSSSSSSSGSEIDSSDSDSLSCVSRASTSARFDSSLQITTPTTVGDDSSNLGQSSSSRRRPTQRLRSYLQNRTNSMDNAPRGATFDMSCSTRSDHEPIATSTRRNLFATLRSGEFSLRNGGGGDSEERALMETVDPEEMGAEPTTTREKAFVISVGIMLAFNMGFVNGACLSGFVTGTKQGVAGYTNPYTDSALAIATGDNQTFKFQTCMIACFIGGSFISGALTPNAAPYRIEPTYGPSFLASALCLGIATILAGTTDHNDDSIFYLAGTASGIQNGISSSYTAKLIRSTGLTGTSTDIGLYLGQWVRGNKENTSKLIVLLLLAIAFWCGGLISFYVTKYFRSLAFLFSTALFLIIGMSLVIFLVKKLNISFRAAVFGTWKYQQAASKIQDAFEHILDMDGSRLDAMSDRELEEIFDRIDIDNTGTIDEEDLYILLRSTGARVTREESDIMLKYADKDKDGLLSKEEFKNAIHTAMTKKQSIMMNTVKSTRNLVITTKHLVGSTRNLVAGLNSGKKLSDRSLGSGSDVSLFGHKGRRAGSAPFRSLKERSGSKSSRSSNSDSEA